MKKVGPSGRVDVSCGGLSSRRCHDHEGHETDGMVMDAGLGCVSSLSHDNRKQHACHGEEPSRATAEKL